MNKSVQAIGLAAALAAASTSSPIAFAQDAKADNAPYTLTGNINLVSQYRYRGIEQTAGKPAVQGGFDFAHTSGVYLGLWGSNISWLSDLGVRGSSLELDLYGGYKRTVGDFGYDAGLLYYYFPNRGYAGTGLVNPYTTELYVAGSWKTLTLKYSHAVTDIFGTPDSKNAGYLDLTGTYPIGAGFNAIAHVGYQHIPDSAEAGRLSSRDASYADWKLGVTYDVVGVTLGLAYVDTNARAGAGQFYRQPLLNRDLGRGTVVLSVGKTF